MALVRPKDACIHMQAAKLCFRFDRKEAALAFNLP
jgi:hypothetical protein